MPISDPVLAEQIARYLTLRPGHVKPKRFLGAGTDGEVWESSDATAIKALMRERGYYNERDTYLRLKHWGLTERIDGFWVPEMLGYDDALMIVEMDMIQTSPYIIDFAKVRLNSPPEFSAETLADSERLGIERFAHRWPEVQSLLRTLEMYQIYYLDPQRGNISFPDMP